MSTKQSTELSVVPSNTLTIGIHQYRVVKQVTRPVLPIEDDVICPIRIEGPIHKGKELFDRDGKKIKGQYDNVPDLLDVEYLVDGGHYELIVNTVLASVLDREYPDQTYVGRYFLLMRGAHHKEDKRYKTFRIEEISIVPDPAMVQAQKASKAG